MSMAEENFPEVDRGKNSEMSPYIQTIIPF